MELIAEFSIEGLPKLTNQSYRSHWRSRHAEAKKWKSLVTAHCLDKGITNLKLNSAVLTFKRHSSVEPDFDGLVSGFKNVIDGLKVSGVIIDDKPSIIGSPTYLWEKCAKGEGKITIKIEG